jgi:signal transduction histidine kinase
MGQMVGEIAHQFNNPLVGVINLAQRAEKHCDDPERVRDLAVEIRKAGEHCSGYVQRMLRFTQLARSEPQRVALEALIRETVVFFLQTADVAPEILCEVPDPTATTAADPVLLRHALFNLIQNAAQADPRGPLLISLTPLQREGMAGWALAVSDHGPGIAPEVADRLFTPFFSTRPGGTGLGLAVARHIAVQHGGDLWAESKPAGGTRFVVWLPVKEESA